MAKPVRLETVKWTLRYLKGTASTGLEWGRNQDEEKGLVIFVNADYAGDFDRRRSITG